MKKLFSFIALFLTLTACGVTRPKQTYVEPKPDPRPAPMNLSLALTQQPRANTFIDLDYGIRLRVYDGRSSQRILQRYDAHAVFQPKVTAYPDVNSFAEDNIKRYMRTMGFSMESDINTDYMMTVNLTEYSLNYISGIGWSATVKMNVEVCNQSGKLVYPNVVAKGSVNRMGSGSNYDLANQTMNEAWTNALEDIDWTKIASFMKVAKHASDEKNKKVKGDGDSALEHQVILWSIYSSPKGADVNWRVISSTPEVKNTNKKYLGTTPFESTETLDIIGLTYNTAGNVQIEVSCEKNGYLLQTKRFNLRSVIDSKEVSTKFNLVKDDE